MRHKKFSQRLGRTKAKRQATLRSLAIALLKNQRIQTTEAKAHLAQSVVEHLILLGKQKTLAARRNAVRILDDRSAVGELFSRIAPLFKEKRSGFSRIIHLPSSRRGDGAGMVMLELTEKLPKLKLKEVKKGKKEVEPKPSEKAEKLEIEPEKRPKPFREKLKPKDKLKPKKFLGGLRRLFKKERDSL